MRRVHRLTKAIDLLPRLTCWPIESHVELDALEDIFKENGRENALKPVLSTILTPGLCAIYSEYLVHLVFQLGFE